MRLHDVSIRSKVTLTIVLVFSVSLLLSTTGVVIVSWMTFKQRAASQLNLISELIAVGVNSSVLFNEAREASSILDRLRHNSEIVEAHVFTKSTQGFILFASSPQTTNRLPLDIPSQDGIWTVKGSMWLVRELKDDRGVVFGKLAVRSNLKSLRQEQMRLPMVLLLVFCVMLGLSFCWLANLLRRSLTEPLLKLSQTAQDISRNREARIHIRAPVSGQDEVGMLAGAFNAMLDNLDAQAAVLADKEARYRELVENANSIIIRMDAECRLTFFNEFAQKFFGFTEKEVIGRPIIETILPEVESSGRNLAHLMTALTRSPDKYTKNENENIRRNGERIWISWTNKPIFDANGRLKEILSIGNDITERRNADEALRNAHEQLLNIIEFLPDPTFVIDQHKKIIAWNQAMEALSGVKKESMLGKGDYEYSIPFFGKRQPIMIDFLDITENETDPAYKYLRKDGDKVYGESFLQSVFAGKGAHLWGVAAPLYDRTGKRWGSIEVIRDVTDRVEIMEQLRRSEKKARAILDSSFGFTGLLSPDGTLLDANRTALNFKGIQLSDVVGKLFWETPWWSHSQDLQEIVRNAVQSASKGQLVRFECTHLSANGSERVIDFSLKPVYDDKGCIIMLIPEGRDITERKQAERQTHLLAQTLKSAQDCISITTLDDIILFVNNAFLKTYGYNEEDLLGRSIHMLRGPSQSPEIATQIRPATLQGGWHGELINRRKDGSEFPVEVWSSVVRDESGASIALVGIARDITASIQAKEAIQKSEVRYRMLFESAQDAIFMMQQNCFIECNPATLQMFLCQREDILGKSPSHFSPQVQLDGRASKDKAQEILAEALSGTSKSFEWRHRRLDNTEFDTEVSLNRIELGGEVLLQAIVRDISERKKAEQELHHLQSLLSNIINSMPSMLVAVDADGKVTQWNQGLEKVTGLKAAQVYGQPLETALPLLAGQMERVRTAIRNRQSQSESKHAVRMEDEIRYHDLIVYPLIANGVQGAVIRVDDVTERVRMEEMLIQSEKMLSVGGLAAGMAHEINNPLAGMIQNAQVMRDRLMGDLPRNIQAAEQLGLNMGLLRQYMELREIGSMLLAIIDSGRRAAQIVQNMLSFSRKNESTGTQHHLAELVDRTIELAGSDYDLKKKYDFKQIKIIREYDNTLTAIPCDAGKIQQVILNILSNGAHALSHGNAKDPTFVVRIRREGNWARIEIEDNGPGMSEPVRKRVFEPFFTTKEVGVGTGLGLSVSYFIVTQNHGGTIDVESKPGKGSCFIIRLPMKREAT